MSKYILATTFSLLVAIAGAQTNAAPLAAVNPGQENPSRVIVAELQLRGTAPVMFAALVVEVGLSGGVAISNQDCSNGQEGSISIPAGTGFDTALGQVANSKVVSEGRLRDGVANLLPAGSEPALLQVRIPKFEWDRTAPVSEVISRLRNLPQVSEQALRLGLSEAPFEGGASAICIRGDCSVKPKPKPVLETESGATLLTVLNQIVKAHPRAVWGYSEYQCDGKVLFSLNVLAE